MALFGRCWFTVIDDCNLRCVIVYAVLVLLTRSCHEMTPRIHVMRSCLYSWAIQLQFFRYCLHSFYDDLKQITWRLWMTSLVHAVSVLVTSLPFKIPLLWELWTRMQTEPQGLVELANAFLMEWLRTPWMNMIRRCLSPWPIHLLIALASCPLRGAAALDALTSGFDIASTQLSFIYFGNSCTLSFVLWIRLAPS